MIQSTHLGLDDLPMLLFQVSSVILQALSKNASVVSSRINSVDSCRKWGFPWPNGLGSEKIRVLGWKCYDWSSLLGRIPSSLDTTDVSQS